MSHRRPTYTPNRRSLLKGTGAMFAGLTFLPHLARADDKKLNIYNYDTYMGETTLDDFKGKTGITVDMQLFASQDEVFAKLKAGNPGFDAVLVANEWVDRMAKANMLMPLDLSKIPNMANLDPATLNPAFDPGRKYSIPYMWGTIGVGYRKSAVGDQGITSWKTMFDSDQFAGKISLLEDSTHVLGCAAKYLGFSYNTTNPDELKKVQELLIKQKKNIKIFTPDNGQDLLAAKEVVACQEWNGDIAQVMKDDSDLTYVIPVEGSSIWEDTWTIPTGAKNVEGAYQFFNYILDAEVGAAIARKIQYATPNLAAKKLMDKDYTENQAIFPPKEALEKSEYAVYLGENNITARDEIWTRIRAA